MKRSMNLPIFLFSFITVVLSACGNSQTKAGPDYTCTDLRAARGNIVQKVTSKGKVKPKEIHYLKPATEGRISEILVQKGDIVKKGQPLVKIIRNPKFQSYFDETRLTLKRTYLRRKSLEKQLLRYEELYKEGLVALVNLEELKISLEEIKLKEQVALERLREIERKIGKKINPYASDNEVPDVTTAYLKAPVVGTILEIYSQYNENIGPAFQGPNMLRDRRILAMADLTRLVLTANVSELDINRIQPGHSVELRFESFPDKTYSGKVRRISSFGTAQPLTPAEQMNGVSGLSRFEVLIDPDSQDIKISSGMSFTASFLVREKQDVLTLPIGSLISTEQGYFVLAREGTSYAKKLVTAGISDENTVEITSGLDEKTIVCDRPLAFLEGEALRSTTGNSSFVGKLPGFSRQKTLK